MQIQNTIGGLYCSGTNGLLTSDFSYSTRRRETQFLLCWPYYLTPFQLAVHLVVFKISVVRDPKNPTTSSIVKIQLSTPNSKAGTQLSACMVQCQTSNLLSDFNFSTPGSDPSFSTPESDPNFSTPWSDPNFSTPGSDPNFSIPWSDLNSIFFKIFLILSSSLLGMTSSTLQPHFLFVVYYDNGYCHILCTRA